MVAQTPIADMITEMHASGIQLDMIIVAVRSMERAISTRHGMEIRVDAAAEKRRAWDRQYRRDKRNRPPDPPDINPNPPDVGCAALSILEKEDSYSEVGSKKERKSRGTKIPPDWKPNQHHYAEGEKFGMSRAAVDARAAAMRNWCDANANRAVTTKANWDAAFTGTWLKDSKNVYGIGGGGTNPVTGRANAREADFIAAVGRGAMRALEAGRTAGSDNTQFPQGSNLAGGDDPEPDTAWLDFEARGGTR